jgi:hypothetical protein
MFNLSFNQYSGHFPSVLIDTFTLYKEILKQYSDQYILNSVRQLIPEKILKLNNNELLKPLFQWFKNDFMNWMPKDLKCKTCNSPMNIQLINGDSWKLRKTEVHMCDICGSKQIFPRYGEIINIEKTRTGRCSEWSMLFGAILNSLSFQTRIVHDYLDHCWNESLIDGHWVHIDSTLDYPISFNHPHYYEKNWGKKYQYILAFSANSLEDVTQTYTEQWDTVRNRRGGGGGGRVRTGEGKNNIEGFKTIYSRI